MNLYVPSKVTWKQGGARASLTQRTDYPNAGITTLQIGLDRTERFTVALRIPAWAGPQTSVRINGKADSVPLQPGGWAKLDRTWKEGDRVELSIDMPLRLVPLDPQHTNLVALVRGPVALFAIDPDSRSLTPKQMLAAQRNGTSSDWEVSTETGKVLMRPYSSIRSEHYRLYQKV